MSIIINIVIPIFAIILCGYLANKLKLLPSTSANTLNHFVYYFALPAILFYSLATAPIEKITNMNFIFANAIIILGGFLVAVFLFFLFFKKKFPDVTLYGMASSYGNTGFLGIPLMIAAFGQEAAVPAAIATFMYDLFLITIVIVSFELANKKQNSFFKTLIKNVFINPINLSLILGIFVALLEISVPQSVQVFTETLGNAAGPTALFALGLGLVKEKSIASTSEKLLVRELATMLSLKLIVQPILAIVLISYFFPLDETWAIALVILSALPTGAMAYVFADRYKTVQEQMPIWILFSTVCSLFTLAVFLMILV